MEEISKEMRDFIFKAIRELKPKYRQIIVMRCYREMEFVDIAKVMDISEFSAKILF